MVKESYCIDITAIGSEDLSKTYEIKRCLNKDGKKALVLQLYPTISVDQADHMDISTLHLMNHAQELNWNCVRVVNLYSNVFKGKPKVSELNEAENSLAYIEDILEEDDIKSYDIIMAFGSSLQNHKSTIQLKIDILTMLKEKGLTNCVKCLMTDNLYINENIGVHVLYLGLRHGYEKWSLIDYPLEAELNKLTNNLVGVKGSEIKKVKERRKNVSKIKEPA